MCLCWRQDGRRLIIRVILAAAEEEADGVRIFARGVLERPDGSIQPTQEALPEKIRVREHEGALVAEVDRTSATILTARCLDSGVYCDFRGTGTVLGDAANTRN